MDEGADVPISRKINLQCEKIKCTHSNKLQDIQIIFIKFATNYKYD